MINGTYGGSIEPTAIASAPPIDPDELEPMSTPDENGNNGSSDLTTISSAPPTYRILFPPGTDILPPPDISNVPGYMYEDLPAPPSYEEAVSYIFP